MNSTAKGKSFEDDVASLYHSLGYAVYQNVTSAGGKQTDLRVERILPGGPKVRLYVECKAYENRSVTSSEVRQFISDFVSISQKEEMTGGVLVTKYPNSRDARDAITINNCKLFTYNELVNELLNINAVLNSFLSMYEKQDIYFSYIPLSALKKSDQEVKSFDLMADVKKWIKEKERLYIILGDFGTGKTTFLNRLKYQLLRERKKNQNLIIPIYISLRNFSAMDDLYKFIEIQS